MGTNRKKDFDFSNTGNIFSGEIIYDETEDMVSASNAETAVDVGATQVMPGFKATGFSEDDFYVSMDETTGIPVKQIRTASVLNADDAARKAARAEAAEAIAMLSGMENDIIDDIPEITYDPEQDEEEYAGEESFTGEVYAEDAYAGEEAYVEEAYVGGSFAGDEVFPEDILPAEEDSFTEADDLTEEEEAELGDLTYHEEDEVVVKPVKPVAQASRPVPRAPKKASAQPPKKAKAPGKSAAKAEPAKKPAKPAKAAEPVKKPAKTAEPAKNVKPRNAKPQAPAGRNAAAPAAKRRAGTEPNAPMGNPSKKGKKSFFASLTWMDYAIGVVALLVLVVAGLGIFLLFGNRTSGAAIGEFASIGKKLGDIEGIGSEGIENVVAIAERSLIETEIEEGETPSTESVAVSVNFVSLEKDLKIKFINKETGEILTGVGFKVDIADPGNKKDVWEDDDKDGIIYKDNLKAGVYMITVEDIGEYDFPDSETPVTVKDKLTYTAIYIMDEVKKEADIDASKEDTENKGNVDVGETLPDTVEWVESSQTKDTKYTKVDYNNDIKNPDTASSGAKAGTQLASVTPNAENISDSRVSGQLQDPIPYDPDDDDDDDDDEPDNPDDAKYVTKISLECSTKTLLVGETVFITEVLKPSYLEDKSVTWKSSDKKVLEVSNGIVTGLKAGKATVTATTNATTKDGKKLEASIEFTVKSDEKKEKLELKIDFDSIELAIGEEKTLGATVSGSNGDNGVSYKSSDEKVCTVDGNGLIKAVGAGEAEITVKTNAKDENGDSVSKKCKVKVVKGNKNDTTSNLTTKTGEQLYVKEGDSYREAKYADYFKTQDFYIKEETIKYTGWQTIGGATYYYDKNGEYVTGEQVIQGMKYTFANNGVLNMNGAVMGIDVSKWNGDIDWNAVKNSGISFVVIRCGYRGSATGVLVQDPKFESYIKGATSAGLKVGLYFFTQAVNETEAVEEASLCVSLAKQYKIAYPIFIDTEKTSGGRANGLEAGARTNVVKAFCETIKSSGYTPGVYASKAWYEQNLNAGSLNGYKIWLAQYATNPSYSGRYDMWQHSAKGKVKGISGDVDLDISYLGY